MAPARLGLFIDHNTTYTFSDDPEAIYKLMRPLKSVQQGWGH